MAAGLGHDFGRVRVHDDAEAARSTAALGARAYAVGRHLMFGRGEYRPHDPSGTRLLAHELAHTVQQRDAVGPALLPVTSPGSPAERESDAAADAVASGRRAAPLHATPLQIARQPVPTDAASAPDAVEDEGPPVDRFAGVNVSEIIVSLARGRVGFRTPLGMILGNVSTDLEAGSYKLRPDLAKSRWLIVEPAVKSGLRFEVDLEGANPWTLAYPESIPLLVAPGSVEEPKTWGDMHDDEGLVDPLWLFEDLPPDLQPRPVEGIDDFEEAHYDLDYRSEGNPSKWLIVHYRDGTRRDVSLDSITEDMPRLLAAKQEALKVIDDYNTMFILHTFPVLWFLLTMSPTTSSGAPQGRMRYVANRRTIPKPRSESSAKQEPAAAKPAEKAAPPGSPGAAAEPPVGPVRSSYDAFKGRNGGLTASEQEGLAKAREYFQLPKQPTKSKSSIVGIFKSYDPDVDPIPLISQKEGGPAGGSGAGGVPRGPGSGFDRFSTTHIEGHAAAKMHQMKAKRGVLLLEKDFCTQCDKNLPQMLPKGSELIVVTPTGTTIVRSSQL